MEKLNPDAILDLDMESVLISADVFGVDNSNASDLKRSFNGRAIFKEHGTPVLLPAGFDFLSTGFYYGKVNTIGRAILPKRESLVRVPTKFTDGEEIFVNKYVYQLYLNFYENLKVDFATNNYDLKAFMEVFSIAGGAGPAEDIENSYLASTADLISDIFLNEVFDDTTNIKDTASDFPSYLKIIYKLFKLGKLTKDVFYSEYVMSGENSMLNSGLMFEIDNVNNTGYDDDLGKYNNYYRYPLYSKIAAYFIASGLRYDANAPWRFVMDLNLPVTIQAMKGISKKEFFEDNFYLVEGTVDEMDLFYEAIFRSYLSLLGKAPLYFRSEQRSFLCSKTYREFKKSSARSFSRQIYSQFELDELYDKNFDNFLIRYAQILNVLYAKGRNQNQLLLDISNKMKKGLDKEVLVRYTFNKMKYC